MQLPCLCCSIFFFFNDTATTEIYTLSLHDALPIFARRRANGCWWHRPPGRCARVNTDRKSTRLNSSHVEISYAVFCLKKKKKQKSTLIMPAFHTAKCSDKLTTRSSPSSTQPTQPHP